jgi:hypothetical protein
LVFAALFQVFIPGNSTSPHAISVLVAQVAISVLVAPFPISVLVAHFPIGEQVAQFPISVLVAQFPGPGADHALPARALFHGIQAGLRFSNCFFFSNSFCSLRFCVSHRAFSLQVAIFICFLEVLVLGCKCNRPIQTGTERLPGVQVPLN